MRKKYILISLVTHEKLLKEHMGKDLLSFFYDKYPLLAPQYANFYEPINKPISNVEEALSFWEGEMFLGRRRDKIRGAWHHSKDISQAGCLSFEYNWNSHTNWFELFQQLAVITKAYFGYVHVFSGKEIEPSAVGSAIFGFLHGVAGFHLKKGIPNLGWANYFGEEYVKEIDVPLLQKNGFNIQKLGDGYVFNVTENLSDVINNYDEFDERRKALKSLFRPELFQKYEPYG